MTTNTEVTAADIARIAGVGRAAVSNWRRRHPDFPAPIGGSPHSPTFALADVEAWLNTNGRAAGVNTAALSEHSRPAESPNARLARVLAALLPPLARGTVLDPACGDGSLLAAAARRLGADLRYVGYDTDPAQLDRARAALIDAGATKTEIEVRSPGGDQVDPVRSTADAVISIVPPTDRPLEAMTWDYGQPGRNDQALAWVQICLAQLKSSGTAVVAVPFAVAVRASGRRIRAELLRAGALTHVIGLPEKVTVATTAFPWQIWMLTRPTGRPAYMLWMVDLTERAPDDLPDDDQAWAAVFADPAHTRDVPSIELLDEDVFLVPAAHIEAEARDVTPQYLALRDRYTESVRRLTDEGPTFLPGDGRPAGILVTVNDLARSGALTFVDRDAASPGDVLVPAGSGGFETFVLDDSERETVAGSVLRCDPEVLDPHFLACFLRADINRRQASGTAGGTFRLDVRRARVPRLPLPEQRRYGEAFRRLMEFTGAADEVAAAATATARTAIYGLTTGIFAPEEQ